MSEPLQLLIRSDGVVVYHQRAEQEIKLSLKDDVSLGEQLAEYFITHGKTGNNLQLFVSEDLLFYKTIMLPLNTQNLKEAIGYQVGMLVPFEEDDLLFSFASTRKKDGYKVTLAATSKERVEPYLEELREADFHIAGLYPDFLRYVTKGVPKKKWALLMSGRSMRLLVFQGNVLEERLLLTGEPDYEELAGLCDTRLIYHQNSSDGGPFLDAGKLLTSKALLKEFNLLPATYRRPEFSKFFVVGLLALNIVTLIVFFAGKEIQLRSYQERINAEIEKIEPLAKEVKGLRSHEQELAKYFEEFMAVGQNPDLIPFLERLTSQLPASSYLDQMRFDGKQKSISIQGYTSDIGTLTAKLQDLGEAQLKSTSRRRNQTYFNVEINLP